MVDPKKQPPLKGRGRRAWLYRVGAERLAKGLKRQFEHLIGAAKIGVDVIDTDFRIVYIDPAWKKIYGDPRGKKCFEYFMGRSRPCAACGVLEAFRTGRPVVSEEVLAKEGGRIVQ
ncbi:MAG: hypothetical protein WCG06_05380, partial [Candidatus Omnitrophota bacterium]